MPLNRAADVTTGSIPPQLTADKTRDISITAVVYTTAIKGVAHFKSVKQFPAIPQASDPNRAVFVYLVIPIRLAVALNNHHFATVSAWIINPATIVHRVSPKIRCNAIPLRDYVLPTVIAVVYIPARGRVLVFKIPVRTLVQRHRNRRGYNRQKREHHAEDYD